MIDTNLIINDISMKVSTCENRIVIKPITDIPELENYSFSMSNNASIENFIDKLNIVSSRICNHR